MSKATYLKAALVGGASVLALVSQAQAANFDIPGGDLKNALDAYARQTAVALLYPEEAIKGVRTRGAQGDLSARDALSRILAGTGFEMRLHPDGAITIVHKLRQSSDAAPVTHLASAETVPVHAAAGVETVVVTSSKIKGDIQTVPIAITALSQEQLTSRQIAGGPDLVKEVPNLTFTKTNFSGYSISIRGIGTQAISVSTDPAVAVALNDIPFIRNHFFEQEFYDVNQVEIVRGPQGTLYGRNATAGVVNVISAKPTDQFEAMLSADIGNYTNRRYEGMVNIPIDEDELDLRIAGEWTKRDGYTTNENTGSPVDGRDLWSTRVTLGWHPVQSVQAYLVWEHFSENDDRMRTQKQLCKTDPGPSSVGGVPVMTPDALTSNGVLAAFKITTGYLSQGCLPDSLYDKGHPNAPTPDYGSFGVPNGYALPYVVAGWVSDGLKVQNPYLNAFQSTNLRDIETQIDPRYIAKNDTVEFNADYNVTPTLTFTSQTGYNQDFLWSTEDYNRFNTTPGIFQSSASQAGLQSKTLTVPYTDCGVGPGPHVSDGTYYFDDPQLGCSNRLVAQDISREHAWQLSQEFRLASNFTGPFNFSVGGNYMHYETVEDYFVFANALTMFAASSGSGQINVPWQAGVSDDHQCLSPSYKDIGGVVLFTGGMGGQYNNPNRGAGQPTSVCYYIDPNPLNSVNGEGHNYFVSKNPYVLNSYAGFGEAYYDVRPDLKLTGGIRWTDDQKHFIDIPSELLANGYGYASIATVDQQWNQLTGRLAANWTPKLDFTDQTLIYGSWAHGYKAGGANPPGAALFSYGGKVAGVVGVPVHPLTFNPEFIDAYELGTKNTLDDGGITLNGDVFFYNYKGYQISEIVDRTSINLNFDATVKGAELEAMYEPLPGLKFNFAGGYEDTRIDNGQSSVDLMDRTAGHPGWVLMKPFVTQPSNCIFPDYVIAALIEGRNNTGEGNAAVSACGLYGSPNDLDPVTQAAYTSTPVTGGFVPSWYPGYDPQAGSINPLTGTIINPYNHQNMYNGVDYGPAPNNGAGFSKNLGGNQLPNAPHFTLSLSGEYTIPVSEDWAATLHSDFYWQSQSFARVFNDRPYDKIRGYSNVNLALILTSASGWQVMGYLKNVFDTTAITGTFLNSDDSGLTTNVFLTDPRLFGVRVTKNW
jgi:iron complex outermembrane receptor protein